MAIPPNAQQILDENNDSLNNIVDNSLGVMPEGLSPEEQEEFRARQLAQMQSGQQQMQTLFQANTEINDATEDAMNKLPVAANSYFDLTKESQTGMNQPAIGQPAMDQGVGEFDSHIDLFQYLEQKLAGGQSEAIDEVRNELFQMVGNQPTVDEQGIEQPNPRQVIADSLQEYLRALQEGNEQKRAKLAMTMFEAMPQSDQGDTMVQGVEEVVAESNETIRRLAKSLASRQMNKQASSSKAFNLKKEAQHKGMDNVIMHGPEGNRIDPFTGQLINDWHVYERNKGWGLKMDDALFIDYEALWRGHIMDKYSRPYRDEDGNYVGGYIEKRFEVDKWIPPGNNYQLKPGEKRRPYLPEYRSTEARMQHMRANNTDEGRVYNDTTEPFNWSKMASSKKLTKTAQFDQPQGMTFIVQDLQTGQELQRLSAPGKDEALQQAQAIARQRSQPVLLLTYDMAADEMDPIEEDMIWPDEAAQPVAASADSKKKSELKVADLAPNPIGRPKSDPFALSPLGLREPGQTGDEAQKAVAPAMKKICPVCGSDNGPNDTVCVNCSASLTGNQKMVDRSPTPKGEQGNPLGHVTAQGVMPTNPNVVKRDMPESMNRRVKRQPVYRELSDDFVDSVEDEHLDQVQHSADHLGL